MAKIHYARVNQQKEIILPPNFAKELGIAPDDEIRIEMNGRGLYLHPSVNTLRRVYVEATNKCNLTCSTCMRNVWDVQYGHMSNKTYERILSGLRISWKNPKFSLVDTANHFRTRDFRDDRTGQR